MYSMDDLLHRLHSDGADGLKLRVGLPPVMVLDGEPHSMEGPAITVEVVEQLLQSVADTRQRRELRENRTVQFIYRFRARADFVVRAVIEDEQIGMDIH
jgi:Tfp pilus assembly ATPase PilU